jgi:hypothetical protein
MSEHEMLDDLAVGVEDGQVYLIFGNMKYVFHPETTVNLANSMLESVQQLGFEIQFEGEGLSQRKQITEVKRNMLVTRCSFIINSTAAKGTLYTAGAVVDTVLAEVL